MADRSFPRVGNEQPATSPIAAIAQAERLQKTEEFAQPGVFDDVPDIVEPSRQLAPQGLTATVDRALGSVKLPTLLELANALDDLSGHLDTLTDIDPALAEVAGMVLQDEQNKVLRYIDLRDT